jgi:hypothetical protein
MSISKRGGFNNLFKLFDPKITPLRKTSILNGGFWWDSTPQVTEDEWYGIYKKMVHNRDCTEELISAFSKVPELCQFLPVFPEEILWE